MRYIYVSKKGGKPLNIGINKAKRIARRTDKLDQLEVIKALGVGMARQHGAHQQLVLSRHRYYHDQHEEFVRARG